MGAKKGHEKWGGRTKNVKNKKTKQWEAFSDYCLTGGIDRFKIELDSLKGRDFVNAFLALLEFNKPKLARTEVAGDKDQPLTIKIIRE